MSGYLTLILDAERAACECRDMSETESGMSPETYQNIRRSLQLSGQEMADRLGVTRQTISMRETGKAPITMEAAMALAWLADSMGYRITHQARAMETQSRNEPCACGSGLKFKRCCGK